MQVRNDPAAHAAIAAELQSLLRTHPALKLEFLASMSRLFREHGLPLEPEILAKLTLSIDGVRAPVSMAGGPPPGSMQVYAGGPPPGSMQVYMEEDYDEVYVLDK